VCERDRDKHVSALNIVPEAATEQQIHKGQAPLANRVGDTARDLPDVSLFFQ